MLHCAEPQTIRELIIPVSNPSPRRIHNIRKFCEICEICGFKFGI
jgi:hypothetical protein